MGSSDQSQLTASPISIQAGLHGELQLEKKTDYWITIEIFFCKTMSIHLLLRMIWTDFKVKDLALGMQHEPTQLI